ncbi:TBC1 domain family member 31 [Blattella germanica]|nr:TBC1 domain family member 31 [Blattella germanica]
MNLEVKSDIKHSGINKQLFHLKTSRKDGLILQVHHTIPSANGDVHRVRFLHVTFDESGVTLAATDHRGNIFIIDLTNRKFWMLPKLGSSSLIAFPPKRKNLLLVGTSNCTIYFVNTELGTKVGILEGHTVPPKQISFSSTGEFCLTAAEQEAIIWNLESNTQAHRLTLRKDVIVKQVFFMPVSDNIIACFQDDAMHVWKFDTFDCVKQILPEKWKSHHLKSIAFTKDGRAMVIGGHTSLLVVFSLDAWNVKKVIELPEDVAGVRHIEFLPQLFDGGANKILGILSSHCTLYFMDIESSRFLKNEFLPHSNVSKFVCSSNGKYIACILQSGEVNVYTTEQLLDIKTSDESVTMEKAETMSSTDTYRVKLSTHGKNRETLKKNLHQLHKEIKEALDLTRLQPILKEFGEYPESYRCLIWKTILQLPSNQSAYVSLVKRDIHPEYAQLENQYALENKTALKNLKRLLSCMAHWSPVFAEVKYLPLFVFPFLKVFQSDPFVCFESVITIVLSWCQHWYDYLPFPPINVLAMIENVLAEHDRELLDFYCEAHIKSQLYAWTLMETAFSEVLSRSEWLCLWDHILSNEPAFFLMAVVSYNILCRRSIMSCQNRSDFEYFFHNQNPIDMKNFISKTYMLCSKTSPEIHPRQYIESFMPLEKGSYPVFNQYPQFVVDYKAHQVNQLCENESTESTSATSQKRRERMQEAKLKDFSDADSAVNMQLRRLLQLRRGLEALEIKLLDAAKDSVTEQKKATLNRLLEDIELTKKQQKRKMFANENVQHDLEQESAQSYMPTSTMEHSSWQKSEQQTQGLMKMIELEAETQKLEKEVAQILDKLTESRMSEQGQANLEVQNEGISDYSNRGKPLKKSVKDHDPVVAAMKIREELLKDSSGIWY